jgi:drug/metabolite transporter (DMT)-like permease
MPASSPVRFGLLITALGGFLFTFDLPLLRMAESDKWTLVFGRGMLLFLSITAVWWFVRHRSKEALPYIAGTAGIAVIITNAIANIALIGATLETNTANVVFILALVPVLTAVFSRIFLGEKVHTFTWVATLLAIFGVAVIVQDSLQFGKVWGDFLALVCACCTAAAFTIIRASRKNVATSLALGSLLSAIIAIAFFPIHLPTLFEPAYAGAPAWVWLLLNGLIVVPLSSTLIANGPRYLPSADVSMFFLLETALTPIWVWMLYAETPSTAVLWGGGLIILTLLVHSLWRLRLTLNETASQSSKVP